MKLSDAYKTVLTAIRVNHCAMLWGPPGIGKSSLIHQIAAELGFDVLDLRLAQLEPTDLRGVPMPDHEIGRAKWFLPDFWPERVEEETTRDVVYVDDDGNEKVKKVKVDSGCCPNGPGIVFLDEIEKAPISVKNASLQLVLNRMIGTYKLPDDWAIMCAGNREDDGCFSAPLGSALSNRMMHMEIEADVDSWASWARENDIAEDIIGFLHARPELLYKRTDDHAFPSPRTWEMASNLVKASKSQREQKDLLAAAVGRGVASEFTVWSNVYKNVDPEAVLSGVIPDFSQKDQSFKYAVTMAVAFHLRKRKNIKKIEDNLAKFIDTISPELRVCFLRQQKLNIMEAMAKSPAFSKVRKDIMSIV